MTDLITVQDFKVYKGINSNTDDKLLISLAEAVSYIIENYCGRSFVKYYSTDKIEYKDSNQSKALLTEFPIVSVTSVKFSPDCGVTQTTLVNNVDYFIDNEYGEIVSNYDCFGYAKVPLKSLEITYKGGFSEAPDDLRVAAMDLLEYYRKQEYTPRMGQDSSIIFHVSSLDYKQFPPHIRRILEFYRINV